MMITDKKPTYVLQGVVRVIVVKGRRPRGTTLPKFENIFEENDSYKADALLKTSLRSRFSIICNKKILLSTNRMLSTLKMYDVISKCHCGIQYGQFSETRRSLKQENTQIH